MPPAPPNGWSHRNPDRVSPESRENAGSQFEVEEAIEEGIQFKWLSTIKQAGDTTFTVEKMQLDGKGFPQPTGEFETIEADSLVLALARMWT